jgi:hypothetical protein
VAVLDQQLTGAEITTLSGRPAQGWTLPWDGVRLDYEAGNAHRAAQVPHRGLQEPILLGWNGA